MSEPKSPTMTFRKWLEDKLSDARDNSNESAGASINSYGAGFDGGYATAIHEILFHLPDSVATCSMDRPVDVSSPGESNG